MLRKLIRQILVEKSLEKQLTIPEPEYLTPGDDEPDEEEQKEKDPKVDFYLPTAESRIRNLKLCDILLPCEILKSST